MKRCQGELGCGGRDCVGKLDGEVVAYRDRIEGEEVGVGEFGRWKIASKSGGDGRCMDLLVERSSRRCRYVRCPWNCNWWRV